MTATVLILIQDGPQTLANVATYAAGDEISPTALMDAAQTGARVAHREMQQKLSEIRTQKPH